MERFDIVGPLVDEGAPFSAIGETELTYLRPRLRFVGNVDAFDMSVDAFDNSYILIKKVRSLCQSVLQC